MELVGERLFPLVISMHPVEFAGKITDILLCRSSLAMLVDILQDPDSLQKEVGMISAGLASSPLRTEEVFTPPPVGWCELV